MIKALDAKTGKFNNRSWIAKSVVLSAIKKAYYHLIILMYRHAGKYADIVLTNSTWTNNHMRSLWCYNKNGT